ncbi:hypothetical protein V1478_008997 [Vespula squamosa]|uniref:Uncharacterized protein n=1 Tax=Vespula squamosa TaxID=30214 RepID=A0ABD2AV32_VESSQ
MSDDSRRSRDDGSSFDERGCIGERSCVSRNDGGGSYERALHRDLVGVGVAGGDRRKRSERCVTCNRWPYTDGHRTMMVGRLGWRGGAIKKAMSFGNGISQSIDSIVAGR